MFVKFLMAQKNNRSGGLAKVCWEMLGAIRVESSARRKLFLKKIDLGVIAIVVGV